MSFDLFFFLVYMSLASFALAFITYIVILKTIGDNKWVEMIVVPLCVVAFDFATMVMPQEYKYLFASIPLAAVVGLLGYAYFFKGISPMGNASVQPNEGLSREEKKYSAKSARIHAARAKRGRE